jgi:hypothetical protein
VKNIKEGVGKMKKEDYIRKDVESAPKMKEKLGDKCLIEEERGEKGKSEH